MIKITLVTVTYNAGSLLQKTLQSVYDQTYSAIEHIIIDGASTDNTVAMAKDYMERSFASDKGHEVRILVEPDNGIYDAMNKGLKLATGDYVCFLNAGDALTGTETIKQVVEAAKRCYSGKGKQHDVTTSAEYDREALPAVVYGKTDIVDGDSRFLRHRRLTPPANLTWRSFRNGMLVCHQAFYARTDIARQTPYDMKYRFSADFDWCVRIMKKAEEMDLPLADCGETIADYMEEGTTTRNHKASLKERFDIMCKYYGKISTCLYHVWFAMRNVVPGFHHASH